MRYDLFWDIYGCTFYIQCSLENKPKVFSQLKSGLECGTIIWQPSYEEQMIKLWKKIEKQGFFQFTDAPFETDFTTQRPIRHNINWIPTENVK